MLKLASLVITLTCLLGCAPHFDVATPISDERFTKLGAPLGAEESKVKLIVLEYLSQEILKDSREIRFVPLHDNQILIVRSRFTPHELRPAVRAEYGRRVGLRDKVTKEPGTLLTAGAVYIHGDEAEAGGGYARGSSITYTFHLSRESGQWRVGKVSSPTIAD